MTHTPCRRIVRAAVPPAFRVLGINAPLLFCWPQAWHDDTSMSGTAYSGGIGSNGACLYRCLP